MICLAFARCTAGSFPGRTPVVDSSYTVTVNSVEAAMITKTSSMVESFGFSNNYPPQNVVVVMCRKV